MARKQFTFYRSFWDAIRGLNQKDRLSALEAICAYALDGEERKMTPTAAGMFVLIKPVLDSAEKKSGGGKKTASNAEDADKIAASNAEDTDNEKEGEVEKEKEGEVEKEKESYISPSTTTRERAREVNAADAGDAKLGRVVAYYQHHVLGAPAPSKVVEALRRYCGVMDEEVITDAFDTAIAEGPGHRKWSYINGILGDRARNGVTDMAGVLRDQEQHMQSRERRAGKNERIYATESTAKADETALAQLARLREKMSGEPT